MFAQAPSLQLLQRQVPPPVLDPAQRYTVDEALALLRTSRASLYKLIRNGALHPIKQGKRTFIAGAEIARLSAAPAGQAA
jgi:Helix-turn-helix domain